MKKNFENGFNKNLTPDYNIMCYYQLLEAIDAISVDSEKVAKYLPSVYDNVENSYDEETDEYKEIYYWYIVGPEAEIEYIKQDFPNLIWSYSNELDCYMWGIDVVGQSHSMNFTTPARKEWWAYRVVQEMLHYKELKGSPMPQTVCMSARQWEGSNLQKEYYEMIGYKK